RAPSGSAAGPALKLIVRAMFLQNRTAATCRGVPGLGPRLDKDSDGVAPVLRSVKDAQITAISPRVRRCPAGTACRKTRSAVRPGRRGCALLSAWRHDR